MAIKDWKKINEGKNGVVFYDKKNLRNIFVFLDREEKKWYVDLDKFKSFKTKSQALSYAKNYMRKH